MNTRCLDCKPVDESLFPELNLGFLRIRMNHKYEDRYMRMLRPYAMEIVGSNWRFHIGWLKHQYGTSGLVWFNYNREPGYWQRYCRVHRFYGGLRIGTPTNTIDITT